MMKTKSIAKIFIYSCVLFLALFLVACTGTDKKAAQEIDDKIALLPEVVALTDEAAVNSAKEGYDALTDKQKEYVKSFDVLEQKLGDIQNLKTAADNLVKATAVVNKITALPAVIKLSDKSAIDEAKTAYNALTSDQKTLVTNYATLTSAETALKTLQQNTANDVKALIAAIPATVNLESETAIGTARAAYDALSTESKALVSNYATLTSAETALTALQTAAINEVSGLISGLPATIALSDEEDVLAAKVAYDALPTSLQSQVTNADDLEEAITALGVLQTAAANAVKGKIDEIGSSVTLTSEEKIIEARAAYNALSATTKVLVTNYNKLVGAEETLAELKQTAANKAINAIKAIPATIDLSSEAAIVAARTAYDALASGLQSLVTNYATLTSAEEALATAKTTAVNNAINLIKAIPATVLPADEDKVVAARTAYDALPSSLQSLVTNYATLTAAEASLSIILSGVKITSAPLYMLIGETNSFEMQAEALPKTAITGFTWSSSNTGVATVDQNGKITGVSAGETKISIISTVDSSFVDEVTVIVESAFTYQFVDVRAEKSTIGTIVTVDGRAYIYGVNMFSTVTEAISIVAAHSTITLTPGTYTEKIVIDKSVKIYGPNYNITGNSARKDEAIITGLVELAADYITLNGLAFTGTSRVYNKGSMTVKNIYFSHNNVYSISYSSDLSFFHISTNDTYGENIYIDRNRFYSIKGSSSVRAIYLMTVKNLVIDTNYFEDFARDILITGDAGGNVKGGLSGIFSFNNNTIVKAGYRGLHITRFEEVAMDIRYNTMDDVVNAAYAIYGYYAGGEVPATAKTSITMMFNKINKALNGIYIDPEKTADFNNFIITIVYNSMTNFRTNNAPTLYHFYSYATASFATPTNNYLDGIEASAVKKDAGYTIGSLYATIEDYQEALENLDYSAAENAIYLISILDKEITSADEIEILAARAAYGALDSNTKIIVYNYNILLKAEAKFAALS